MNPPIPLQHADPKADDVEAVESRNRVFAPWAVSALLGWLAAGMGVLILIGWITGVPILKSMLPGLVEAKANTAVCFILMGAALGLKAVPRSQAMVNVANVCAELAALIGLLTLAEYLLGWNFGIDQALFTEPAGAVDTVHPGRMAAPAALNFVLLGVALLLLGTSRARAAAWMILFPSAVAILAFVGYLYGLPALASFGPFTPIAAPSGLTFLLLCAGVLLAAGGRLLDWLRRKARIIGATSALALLLLVGGAIARNARLLVQDIQWVEHTHVILDKLGETLSEMEGIAAGMRGYLLSGDKSFLEPVRSAPSNVDRLLKELAELMADNPAEEGRLSELRAAIGMEFALVERQTAMRASGDAAGAQASVSDGRRLMGAVRLKVDAMVGEEKRLLEERRLNTAAGSWKTLLTMATGMLASIGLLLTVFQLLHRENSRRARTEEALRRSEESLAVTLQSIGDAVLATDTEGRITRANRVAEELTGWAVADAHGRPIAEVFHIINEESRGPAVIPVASVLATGEIHGLANHTVLIARDGSERAIADSAAPIRGSNGQILGVVLVFRDVTKERAAEAKLAAALAELDRFFTLSLDFLCIASADGYFKRVSPAVTEVLGWSVEEFLARPFISFVHPEDHAATLAEVDKQVREGQRVLHFENRYSHKDGSWRVLSWKSAPQPDGLMYATARDVTESRHAEDLIRRLNDELRMRSGKLEEANKELEAFSYSVSHDLRAPLRHVQGYAEMLARETQGQLSDKAHRHLATISDASRDMGRLIDDLLSFSKMGRAEMRGQAVDLNAMLQDVRRDLESAAEGRNIRWSIANLPTVEGDPAMLRQVWANLLGNAVKYTRPRDPAIIEVGCDGREGDRLVLFVRDNGAGFDMKYSDKLFGVFQRLHHSDEFEGTGIGLANVKRIITRHGGRVWAEAKPGEGAVFYVTLKGAAGGQSANDSREHS